MPDTEISKKWLPLKRRGRHSALNPRQEEQWSREGSTGSDLWARTTKNPTGTHLGSAEVSQLAWAPEDVRNASQNLPARRTENHSEKKQLMVGSKLNGVKSGVEKRKKVQKLKSASRDSSSWRCHDCGMWCGVMTCHGCGVMAVETVEVSMQRDKCYLKVTTCFLLFPPATCPKITARPSI